MSDFVIRLTRYNSRDTLNGASCFGCDYDSVEITCEIVGGERKEKRYQFCACLKRSGYSRGGGGGGEGNGNDCDEFIIGFTQTIVTRWFNNGFSR